MMKRQPRFEEKFYYNFSLERLVPEDHLLRLIGGLHAALGGNVPEFGGIRSLAAGKTS